MNSPDQIDVRLGEADCLAFPRSRPDSSVDLIATDPIVRRYARAAQSGERWFTSEVIARATTFAEDEGE
jgi:hypothetical protein